MKYLLTAAKGAMAAVAVLCMAICTSGLSVYADSLNIIGARQLTALSVSEPMAADEDDTASDTLNLPQGSKLWENKAEVDWLEYPNNEDKGNDRDITFESTTVTVNNSKLDIPSVSYTKSADTHIVLNRTESFSVTTDSAAVILIYASNNSNTGTGAVSFPAKGANGGFVTNSFGLMSERNSTSAVVSSFEVDSADTYTVTLKASGSDGSSLYRVIVIPNIEDDSNTVPKKTIYKSIEITPDSNSSFVKVGATVEDISTTQSRWRINKYEANGYISFTLGNKSKVKIRQHSTSKTLSLSTELGSTSPKYSFSTEYSDELELEAGTYYLYCAGNSFYVYSITVDMEAVDGTAVVYPANGGTPIAFESLTAAVDYVNNNSLEGASIAIEDGDHEIAGNTALKLYTKNVRLESKSGNADKVVIYGKGTDNTDVCAGTQPLIWVAADGVEIHNITVINTTNIKYKSDYTVEQTIDKHAALAVMSSGCNFTGVHLVSVERTVYIGQSRGSTLSDINFNSCVIEGCTDWICGGGKVEFNDCEFVYRSEKNVGMIFAPSIGAEWNVRGGELSGSLSGENPKYYYGRAWLSKDDYTEEMGKALSVGDANVDYPTLNIIGVKNSFAMGNSDDGGSLDGLMGFWGVTSGAYRGSEAYLTKCDFNVYSAANVLIASTNADTLTTKIGKGVFKKNADVQAFDYKYLDGTMNKLIVSEYSADSEIRSNIIPDLKYGFMFISQPDRDTLKDITDNTLFQTKCNELFNGSSTVKSGTTLEDMSDTLFSSITADENTEMGIIGNVSLEEQAGKYYAVLLLENDTDTPTEAITGSYYIIPFLALDGEYTTDGVVYDKTTSYIFGSVMSVTL